ncbi:hypothetical protein OG555_32945 [Kribbella sp. NBC_01484]|uniref:hypothetical protein n=1 Tax=Kribbella sp. NBC_01484 TaxID=2903579 RepID=UPI002E33EA94|nr:hypothetical protein [Kribbella sp. NBC_01484]
MTTVRMPVRVRVEVTEDRVDDDLVWLVTDAVDAALGRAVDRALTVRIVSEAKDCRAAPTAICFSGDPLPGRVAGALEESLLTSVDLAVARLSRRTTTAGDEPDESGEGEVRDDDRVQLGAAGDAYLVPYYDQNAAHISMRLDGLPRERDTSAGRRPRRRLSRFQNSAQVWAEVVRRSGGAPPDSIAVVGAPASGEGAFVAFFAFDGERARQLDGMQLQVWDFKSGDRQAQLTDNIGLVSADQWSLYGQASGAAQVFDLFVEAMMVELRQEAGGGADQAELRRQAERKIKRLPDWARVKDTLYLYQLTADGSPVWIGAADPRLPRGPVDVLVLSEDDPDAPKDTYGKCPPLNADEPFSWLGMFGLLHDSPSTPDTPFLGEQDIALWPHHISVRLSHKVAEVAGLLHMSPGNYVGGFLIAAMVHIDRSCRTLVRNHAPMAPQLRNMAAAFGAIKDLEREYITHMLSQDDKHRLRCPIAGHAAEWVAAFAGVFGSARDDAVASMFVTQCQDVLLQVLLASGDELSKRAQNFKSYMAMTRVLLTVMLADLPELMRLRQALLDELQRERVMAIGIPGGLTAGWIAMTGQVIGSLTPDPDAPEPEAGTVAPFKNGPKVYDGRGRWWTLAELDAVLSAARQQVTAIDPVLDKVPEVEDLVEKLRAAQVLDAYASTAAGHALTTAVDDIFKSLLTDLIKENEHWQRKAAADRKYAFGLANFSPDDKGAETDIGAKLSGIHKIAAERLRPAFTDEEAYVTGMARLAETEIGKAELFEILNLVGMTVLAVVCAPLAFAVGAVQAVEGLETAFEHRDLQRAMLDADDILSKAQVEAEMWAAVINAALTVLPEIPSAVRGARSAGSSLIKREATEAAVAATQQAMRNIAKRLAELSLEHFTVEFTKQLTQGYLINLALSKAMNRITDAVAHQVAVTGEATIGDLGGVLDLAIEGSPEGGTP